MKEKGQVVAPLLAPAAKVGWRCRAAQVIVFVLFLSFMLWTAWGCGLL
jgi:hypothetical protein